MTGPARLARPALAALLVAVSCTLGGCLIGSSNTVSEYGTPVDGSVVARVEPGVTTEDWLIATLGAPTSATDVTDGSNTRILRYEHVVEKRGDGHLFLVFAGSSSSRTTTRTYFEVQDGLVTRYWSDAGA